MRKILIRFDDICPTMDFEQWSRAENILKRYNIKPLLGVIPECRDEKLKIEKPRDDFWNWIKKLQESGYALAMHGCFHQYTSHKRGMVSEGYNSEFAGLPYEEQFELISHGKNVLEEHGIKTDIFFAPAHSYDKNTLKAISDCGFKYMSDGKSIKAYKFYNIKCLPCRSGGVPYIGRWGYYTAIFHAHEWTRDDKKEDFQKLEKLCSLYTNDIVSFDEYKNQPGGNKVIQQLIEKIYVFLFRFFKKSIRPKVIVLCRVGQRVLNKY